MAAAVGHRLNLAVGSRPPGKNFRTGAPPLRSTPRNRSLADSLLKDASLGLGLWRRKFYSCTAIEKEIISLCTIERDIYRNIPVNPGNWGSGVSHAIPARVSRSAKRRGAADRAGDSWRAKIALAGIGRSAGALVCDRRQPGCERIEATDVARIEFAKGDPLTADLSGVIAILCAGAGDTGVAMSARAKAVGLPVNVMDDSCIPLHLSRYRRSR